MQNGALLRRGDSAELERGVYPCPAYTEYLLRLGTVWASATPPHNHSGSLLSYISSTLDVSISAPKMKLWCALEGACSVFSVKVDDTDNVADLKRAIKKELSPKLDGIDVRGLTLWKINKSSEEALKLTRADLQGEKPLNPMATVRECWTDLSAARMVHVFIAVPLQTNSTSNSPATDRIIIKGSMLRDELKRMAVLLPGGCTSLTPVRREVLDANKILVRLLPVDVAEIAADAVARLPEKAREFCNMLSRLVPLPKVGSSPSPGSASLSEASSKPPTSQSPSAGECSLNGTDSLVKCFKEVLGPQFATHFEEVDDISAENIRTLIPFLTANFRHDKKGARFTSSRSACYKKACLTSVLVDSVLDRFEGAFVRDEVACDMVLEINNELYSWRPQNDFQLRYDYAGRLYGLLHGETESLPQTEDQAMRKMAIMSLYSHKVIKYATGQEQVILCPYVSEEWCTMYLFFPDPGDSG
ncbi:hypothetical protein FRB99_001490, partial [Tulasnella sp. 403]